jgi:molybdopterin biosynthesis enzyme
MFMLVCVGEVPVVGLPGCVMYATTIVFDLVVPRIVAGEKVARADIAALGPQGCA